MKKKTEEKRQGKGTKKTGSDRMSSDKESVKVPFFRSIRMRLLMSFFIPVICIVVLGIASYQKSFHAIVNNYKSTTEQTTDMMQQYISLIVTSEKDEFKTYLSDDDMTKYFNGLLSAEAEASTAKSFNDTIRNKLALDSKVEGIYFISDAGKSLYSATSKLPADAYSAYVTSEQGQLLAENAYDWFLFGQDEEADTTIGIPTEDYSLRLVRKMNDKSVVMMIDLDAVFIRDAMQSLDPGTNGYVALVTGDGNEFYSDSKTTVEGSLIYGQDFYEEAVASGEEMGNQTIHINGEEYLFVYSKLESGDAMIAALIPSDRLLAESQEIKQLTMVLTIVAALIAVVLGTLISGQMSGTIRYILRQLRKVSDGNLTVHLSAKKRDEFGLLCDGVNDTVEHMKGLIAHVNEVSMQLTDAAAYVSDASGTFMETSHDIRQAVSEIEIGVNRLDSSSENCLTQMDSLSGKITNVSLNADEIGKLTSSTGTTIHHGIESVQGLTDSAASTAQITRNVIDAIEELEEKSKSISKIVLAINDIAEQTNLLSLNASIEAARAGDAGKGFAVVAEEIRKLSDQCLGSAAQISDIVSEIVEKTGQVVVIAKQAEEVVSTQAGAVENTTDSFRQIDRQVASLLTALSTISANVQEMNASRSGTLEAIESISAVSAETAACSTSVYSTAGTQLDASQDMDKAAGQLRERADKLAEILANFTV